MTEDHTIEEQIALTAQVLGISEEEARVVVSIERGESDGDVVIEQESSTRVTP